MASASDIATVRLNTDEPDDTNGYTDALIGSYVDADGVAGASATIWSQKAAKLTGKVNVSEAGSSHAMSDQFKHAKEMAEYWTKVAAETGGVVVRKIVRT